MAAACELVRSYLGVVRACFTGIIDEAGNFSSAPQPLGSAVLPARGDRADCGADLLTTLRAGDAVVRENLAVEPRVWRQRVGPTRCAIGWRQSARRGELPGRLQMGAGKVRGTSAIIRHQVAHVSAAA